MRNQLILLGVFMLFGLFLLRGGITGFGIAENCPGNDCSNVASFDNPAFLTLEDSIALSAVGLLIIIISISLVFEYLKRKTRQEKA